MPTLDDNMAIIDPSDVPFINTSVKYGLIGGAIITVYTLLAGILGLNQASGMSAMIGIVASIAIYSWITSSAIKQHRNEELGGYITMGRAFLVAFVACLITGLIGGLVGYIYYNFIDPGSIELIVESTAEMMEGFGLDDDQIEEAIKATRDGFGLGKLMLNTVIMTAIFGGIISAIVGAVMKKEPPMA